MRVLCLQGSLGEPSRTASLVTLAERLLTKLGAEVRTWDLRRTQLPLVDPHRHGDSDHPEPIVQKLLDDAHAAAAFLWASPVYHNSYSGVLKNALDHLSISQVADKPVALCANGGRTGSVQPTDHLRIVARGLHGVAIPRVLVARNDDFRLNDGSYLIADRGLVTRMIGLCQQLLDYGAALAPLRTGGQMPAEGGVTPGHVHSAG